jgi:hypothetical protein
MYKCRFTLPVWKSILAWCGIHGRPPESWINEPNVDVWWTNIALGRGQESFGILAYAHLLESLEGAQR